MNAAFGTIASLVIIVCSIYLYDNYNKSNSMSKERELIQGKKIVARYAIIGGFIAFILFLILQNMFNVKDVQGFIFIATITLSLIICGCTGWIVKTLKSLDVIKRANDK